MGSLLGLLGGAQGSLVLGAVAAAFLALAGFGGLQTYRLSAAQTDVARQGTLVALEQVRTATAEANQQVARNERSAVIAENNAAKLQIEAQNTALAALRAACDAGSTAPARARAAVQAVAAQPLSAPVGDSAEVLTRFFATHFVEP